MLKVLKYLITVLSLFVLVSLFSYKITPLLTSKVIIVGIILSICVKFWENGVTNKKQINNEVFLIETKSLILNLIMENLFAFSVIVLGVYGFFDGNMLFQSIFKAMSYKYGGIHISFNLALVLYGIVLLSSSVKRKNVFFEFKDKVLNISHPNSGKSKLDFAKNDYEVTVDNQNIIFRNIDTNDILVMKDLNISNEKIDDFTNWVLDRKEANNIHNSIL